MNRTILFLASLPLMVSPFASSVTLPAFAGSLDNQPSQPVQLAQRGVCPRGNPSQFVHAETRNFTVYICGGDLPHTYVGIAKNGNGRITLPLQEVSRNTFVAVNRNNNGYYRYVLTRNLLTVTRNGRTIVRESARWIW
jgi:hypothetical protein